MSCSCAALEEARERIAWLESELGMRGRAEVADRLRRALHQPGQQRHAFGAAKMLAALYTAQGRPLSLYQLMEASPPASGAIEDDRDPKLVVVWISSARKGLGFDAIATVWGHGYRLTPEGIARVAEILGDTPDSSPPRLAGGAE